MAENTPIREKMHFKHLDFFVDIPFDTSSTLGRFSVDSKLQTHFDTEPQFSLYHVMPDMMVLAGLGSSAVFK